MYMYVIYLHLETFQKVQLSKLTNKIGKFKFTATR